MYELITDKEDTQEAEEDAKEDKNDVGEERIKEEDPGMEQTQANKSSLLLFMTLPKNEDC